MLRQTSSSIIIDSARLIAGCIGPSIMVTVDSNIENNNEGN